MSKTVLARVIAGIRSRRRPMLMTQFPLASAAVASHSSVVDASKVLLRVVHLMMAALLRLTLAAARTASTRCSSVGCLAEAFLVVLSVVRAILRRWVADRRPVASAA